MFSDCFFKRFRQLSELPKGFSPCIGSLTKKTQKVNPNTSNHSKHPIWSFETKVNLVILQRWHSFVSDAAYSSRSVVRMPLCDRVRIPQGFQRGKTLMRNDTWNDRGLLCQVIWCNFFLMTSLVWIGYYFLISYPAILICDEFRFVVFIHVFTIQYLFYPHTSTLHCAKRWRGILHMIWKMYRRLELDITRSTLTQTRRLLLFAVFDCM